MKAIRSFFSFDSTELKKRKARFFRLFHFRIHWIGGKRTEEVIGRDIANACRKAGIGMGALHAMDYFEPIKRKK